MGSAQNEPPPDDHPTTEPATEPAGEIDAEFEPDVELDVDAKEPVEEPLGGHGERGLPRVLVTGAGGPAAVALIRRFIETGTAEIVAADIDPLGAGLYLVPPERRFLVPPGDDLGFPGAIAFLCTVAGIDVVIPTVDTELLPLARVRAEFDHAGVALMLTSEESLAICLDKLRLARHCEEAGLPVPETAPVDATFDPDHWAGPPCIVKPRAGSGGRGVRLLRTIDELRELSRYAGLMVQEYLPGEEYSIDVLAGPDGVVAAVVPRARMKVDSGIAVAGRTLHDEELEAFGRTAAEAIGLSWVANVQCRRDDRGRPKLLEINPRFPGTMPLTVAAGVDMPLLALAALLGTPMPADVPFTDTAMVRHWADVVVPVGAFDAVPRVGSDQETRQSPRDAQARSGAEK